jgi:hypothetical protein
MSNIQLFDTYTAEIFKILYENFPVCKDIKPHEIVNSIEAKYEERPIGDIPMIERQICSSALHWLRDNNLISVYAPSKKTFTSSDDVSMDELFSCVVLTAKGLAVLKQVPKSIQEGASLGEEISDAVKKGMFSKASELVGVALSGAMMGVMP